MDALVPMNPECDLDLSNPNCTLRVGAFCFHEQGVTVQGHPPFEEWELAMNVLGMINRRMVKPFKIWVAVMLLRGEAQYGETYAQAMEDTKLAYQTLANARTTVRHYIKQGANGDLDLSGWHPNLSFEHHVIVQSLPEQAREEWLKVAESDQMTTDELRGAVHRGEKEVPTLCCTACGTTFELSRPAKIVKTIRRGKGVLR